jgi:hypothetical protein
VSLATLLFAGLILAAWLHGLLLAAQAWECRRYARSKLRADSGEVTGPRTAVIVPCKGYDPDLESNLRVVLAQDYHNYEVLFGIESDDDDARPVIDRVCHANPRISTRVVCAGRCCQSGQKIDNLLAAISRLPDRVEVLAFLDADARPGRTWLRSLLANLNREAVGATTGYRWLLPKRGGLANYLAYSINSAVAGLLGPGGHHLVWGGSWAIRREVFEQIGIGQAWQGTLSDDLVASRALHGSGLPVLFEPGAVTLSPVDFTLGSVWEFMRRQYVIGRRYAAGWWKLAVAANSLAQAVLWIGLLAALLGWGVPTAWRVLLLTNSLGLYGLHVFRGAVRQSLSRLYVPTATPQLTAARKVDVLLAPLMGLLNLAVLWSSAVGSRIRWRGIAYWISPGGRILLLGRQYTPSHGRPQLRVYPPSITPGVARVASVVDHDDDWAHHKRAA